MHPKAYLFFSILSRHVEHKRCPFFFQNVFVDLSISFLQIRHLNIGVIKISSLIINLTKFPNLAYQKKRPAHRQVSF